MEALIDKWSICVYDQLFWQADTANVFEQIVLDAKDLLVGILALKYNLGYVIIFPDFIKEIYENMDQQKNTDSSSIFDKYLSKKTSSYKNSESANIEIKPVYACSEADVVRAFESLDWSFDKDVTSYLSHDIHPYPAKFAPQMPAQIIKLLSSMGECIWDPFGGSGTTALEALLSDRSCISTDINPIGCIIGKAKTTALCMSDEQELERFISKLEYYGANENYLIEFVSSHESELGKEIPVIPNIEKWFKDCVICELAFIKYLIKQELHTDVTLNIAKASLSKIITKVSNQENETTYRAVQKEFHISDVTEVFLKDLKTNFSKIKELSALIGYRSCRFFTTDVMKSIVGVDLQIKDEEVDLIVTSPPYPNAFDYHLYHRFRIFWLDGDPRAMGKVEIGSHLKYQRNKSTFEQYEEEMALVLVNCLRALKAGRYATFILGNAVFEGTEYKTAERIGAIAETIGFDKIAIFERPLPKNKRSVKSWARRATTEQILLLKKPMSSINATLIPVDYKLWSHEKVLSHMERKALAEACSDTFLINPYDVNRLKKLTFYKGYKYNNSVFETWQSILEHGMAGDCSSRKDPKYLTHGIHPYKGKFYPQLVRPLLSILKIPIKGAVFDPFCGSGTVALESVLNGYNAFGCDINPIAVEIASAKNTIFTVPPYEFEKHIAVFRRELLCYENIDYNNVFLSDAMDEIHSWFPDKVVDKMGLILTKINSVPDERIKCFLRVILSSIIREISQQEPSDLRIRRRKEPIMDAPVIEMYLKNLDKQYNSIMAYYMSRNLAPETIGQATIWKGNSTKLGGVKPYLPTDGVDIVITSPPYATALPYIDTNRLNMLVLDGINASKRVPIEAEMTGTREIIKSARMVFERKIEANDFGSINSTLAKDIILRIHKQNITAEVGFRRKNMASLIYMYFRDITDVMNTIDKVVKISGYICIIIGDTSTTTGQEKVIIRTTEVIRETAQLLNWRTVSDIPINVSVERYVHMNNSITENNILIFQRI